MRAPDGSHPVDLFVSYNWRDAALVERIVRDLRDSGLTSFFDRWYLTPGRPWPEALEAHLENCGAMAVFLGPHGLGRWQRREVAVVLARQARESDFPVIPVLLPGAVPPRGFLEIVTWIDFRGRDDFANEIAALVAASRGEPLPTAQRERAEAARASVCPYRGLRPFREEDAALFFGREPYVDDLLEKVAPVGPGATCPHPLVAVVGASGRGKSSVVRAGLVPRLRQAPGGTVWEVVTMVPDDRPLRSLAAALLPPLEDVADEVQRLRRIKELTGELESYLDEEDDGLRDVVQRILVKQPGTDRLLLIVDQWEQLYTECTDATARNAFIDVMLRAVPKAPLSIVLTARDDFYSRLGEHRELIDRLRDAMIHLGPMTRDELQRVIVEPARTVRLEFEPGLDGRILQDVESEPDCLPLLEDSLEGLWHARRHGMLTHDAYEAMQGVKGAVARRAEDFYGSLPDDRERERARLLFVNHLVRVGLETGATRRRAVFAALDVPTRDLVRKLADVRLVVTSRDAASGEEVVEVVHEAVIRGWERLRHWLEEDRDFLLWRERLRADMDDWKRLGEKGGALLHDDKLVEALRWDRRRKDDLDLDDREFIRLSVRRRRGRRLNLAAVVAVILVAAVAAAWIYRIKDTQAENAKFDALCEEISNVATDPARCRSSLGEAHDLKPDRVAGCLLRRGDAHEVFEILTENPAPEPILDAAYAGLLAADETESENLEQFVRLIASVVWAVDYARPKDGRLEGRYRDLRDQAVRLLRDRAGNPPQGLLPSADGVGSPAERQWLSIQANEFRMSEPSRDSDEKPHQVGIATDFRMLVHEVTIGEWRAFDPDYALLEDWARPQAGAADDLPVMGMSWYAAYAYSVWLGGEAWVGRLPTESEWEFAARGKREGEDFPWGNGEVCEGARCRANTSEAGIGEATPACDARFERNGYGLCDMAGNVWEWVADWYEDWEGKEFPSLTTDPWGPPRGERRVIRGGSFVNDAWYARCAYRSRRYPRDWFINVGFRVVLLAAPSD